MINPWTDSELCRKEACKLQDFIPSFLPSSDLSPSSFACIDQFLPACNVCCVALPVLVWFLWLQTVLSNPVVEFVSLIEESGQTDRQMDRRAERQRQRNKSDAGRKESASKSMMHSFQRNKGGRKRARGEK
mmetsp:Transcript_40629/g.80063  ORF Transcript_40629/g.80063 Transcript_40629/m.80063 type:complete len:131 (+) Transcript_40629:1321-1713(+)